MKRDSRCKTCQHPEWKEINEKINAGYVLKHLAEDYKVPYSSLFNHAKQGHHLPNIQQQIKKKKTAAILLSKETQLMVQEELSHKIDTVNEAATTIELLKKVVDRSMKIDEEKNGVSGRTISALSELNKSIHRYESTFGDLARTPEVQIAVIMPTLKEIAFHISGSAKKEVYDAVQIVQKKHAEALDISYEIVEEEEGVEIKIENRKED